MNGIAAGEHDSTVGPPCVGFRPLFEGYCLSSWHEFCSTCILNIPYAFSPPYYFLLCLQDDFAHLRPLCYPQVDVALICYSVVDHTSFDNVRSKWVREVHRHCPGVPIILVGTQTDRRIDSSEIKRLKSQGKRPLTKADGNKLASQCKATCYLECSALTQQNVKHTFDEAIATGLELNNRGSKHTPQCSGCTIL